MSLWFVLALANSDAVDGVGHDWLFTEPVLVLLLVELFTVEFIFVEVGFVFEIRLVAETGATGVRVEPTVPLTTAAMVIGAGSLPVFWFDDAVCPWFWAVGKKGKGIIN